MREITKGFYMFIEGLITYNDVFPSTGLHTLKFCYRLAANISEDNKIIPSYFFCDHWNCADAECDEDRKNYDREIAEGNRPARRLPPSNTQTKTFTVPKSP
jgi:hypothetical protein